ncbi:MAG: hypothetical protein IT267_06815 [Saprospiraceae bacterium]|nr:hypothetical protein [Saprospiraceae bacterium]
MNYKIFFTILIFFGILFQCKKKPESTVQVLETKLNETTLPDYWKQPSVYEWGREPARADFKPVENEGLSLANQLTGSEYYTSLNGFWKYRFFTGPDYIPAGIEKTSNHTSWLDMSMPGFAELKGFGKPVFKYYSLPFKNDFPHVPSDSNSVLILNKSFEIPDQWKERDIYAVFEGVSTSYFLYVNGNFAGYNEDTKCVSEYKINQYLQSGLNDLTLILIKYTDGSYFETHNQWLLTGINRNAYLLARPKIMIKDFYAKTNIQGTSGTINLDVDISNNSEIIGKNFKLESKLIDDQSKKTIHQILPLDELKNKTLTNYHLKIKVNSVKTWSDETPSTYTLVLSLKNQDNKTSEYVSSKIAFCTISYKNKMLINNKSTKIKGVVCHEFHPIHGNILDPTWIDNDMDVMKLHHINAIRNNHYPMDSYWYQSALKYGLWIMDECNLNLSFLQSGGIDLSEDSSLSPVYLQRIKNTFERNKNIGNIIVWSLGYNAGIGKNLTEAYQYIKNRDKKRPVSVLNNQQSFGDLNLTDDSSNTKALLQYQMANNQGNGLGGMDTKWENVKSRSNNTGGFIEDFTDQCFYMKNKHGQLFFGYGGVFGETNSDSFLCARGLLTSNKAPSPALKNLSSLFSNFTIVTQDLSKGDFIIKNNYHTYEGSNFNYFWVVDENSEKIKEGKFEKLFIGAGKEKKVHVPIELIQRKPGKEYCIILSIEKIENHKGMFRFLSEKIQKFCLPVETKNKIDLSNNSEIKLNQSETLIEYNLDKGKISIDAKTGFITQWIFNNKSYLQSPIYPMFHRAPTDLDILHHRLDINNFWRNLWTTAQLNKRTIDDSDKKRIKMTQLYSFSNNPGISCSLNYTILANHEIILEIEFENQERDMNRMPRLSYRFEMESSFGTFQWYGRGPYETYPDRKKGLEIGLFKNTIPELNIPKIRPQETANRTDVRWAEISTFSGERLCIIAEGGLDVKALPFPNEDLEGKYKYGVDVKVSKHNHIIIGNELWPLDDFNLTDLKIKKGELIHFRTRLKIYQSDQTDAFNFYNQKSE